MLSQLTPGHQNIIRSFFLKIHNLFSDLNYYSLFFSINRCVRQFNERRSPAYFGYQET